MYWLDLTRGRENGPGQAFAHVYPSRFLGLELAGVYGQESNQNHLGVRPSAYLNLGGLKVIGGWEYREQSPQTDADRVEVTSKGYAGRVQYSFARAGSDWLRAPPWANFAEHAG
jgi:hypothetical protein